MSDCLEHRVQQQGEQPAQKEEVLGSARGVSEAQELGTKQEQAEREQPVQPKLADEPAEQGEPARLQPAKVQVQPEQPEEQQGQEQAETSTAGVSEPAAAAAAYVQASGGSGDKRRRVTPDLLLDVQRSGEASAMEERDEAAGGASGPRCRLPTPGATPKRKLRRSSASDGAASPGSADVHDAMPAAAEDPAVEPPAVAAGAAGAELQNPAAAQRQGVSAGPAASNAVALVPQAEVPVTAAQAVEEQEWATFQLFDDKWFGSRSCSSTSAVAGQPLSLSRPGRSGSGCAMM